MSYIRGKGRGRGDSASTKNPFFNSPGNHRTPVSTGMQVVLIGRV